MRVAAQTVGIVAVVPAFWFLVQAVWTPFRYALATASAPQVTQVYAEGSYDALPAPKRSPWPGCAWASMPG